MCSLYTECVLYMSLAGLERGPHTHEFPVDTECVLYTQNVFSICHWQDWNGDHIHTNFRWTQNVFSIHRMCSLYVIGRTGTGTTYTRTSGTCMRSSGRRGSLLRCWARTICASMLPSMVRISVKRDLVSVKRDLIMGEDYLCFDASQYGTY